MDELLAAAAAALDAPAAMVERSAAARAKADGVAVEDVLSAWAGGGAITPSAPAASAPAEPAAPAAPAEPTAATGPPAVAQGTDDASLIAAAAIRMSMPESMIKRSAAARAKAAGTDAHSVLLEWAGVDPNAVPASPPAAAAADAPPAPATPAAPATPTAPAAASMSEEAVLAAAAEKMGMSESMVKRSAGARAKATGSDVAAVLAEWAGVVAPAAPSGGGAAEPTPADAPASAAPAPAAAAPAPAAEVEVLGEEPPAVSEPAPAAPDSFEPKEAALAAGALPRWLAALFIAIPAFAIGYALFLPNGPNCGDAGSLAVDPVTGLAVNCDGSEYGSEEVDLFSLGEEVYAGIGCVACHGAGGGGVANFPAFTGGSLLATFPQDWCAAQIEWITLGTQGWPDPTYGATGKPVGGSGSVMPGFAGTLSYEEISAVALYERVAFGGQDLGAAKTDCAAPAAGTALGG